MKISGRLNLPSSFAVLVLLMVGFTCPTVFAADPIAGIASIIDADTIEIHGTRIRLVGIDAPEGRQLCQDAAGKDYRCGQVAALALADHIGSRTVECRGDDYDRYGRTVAVCYLGSEDIGAWLVFNGLALAYRKYSNVYVADEDAARAARRGLWAGNFIPPWEWRAQDRGDSPSEPSENCCKVCTTGQACGNSCISRSKVCTKPTGCACDG